MTELTAMESLLALRDHLKTITVANGYPMTVGDVALDRGALAVGSDAKLPIITLLMQRDVFDRQTDQGDIECSAYFQSYLRVVELEGFVDTTNSGWELALESFLLTVRIALQRYPKPLRMTPPRAFQSSTA